MNVPAIARRTFEMLRNQPEFLNITHTVITHLKKIKSSLERARFVHNMVDEYNKEVFAHPILKEMVPCKAGCSGCCHTQVSVTSDEAELLAHNILTKDMRIDYTRLEKQAAAENDAEAYFKIPYNERRCVFLDEKGACTVYKDRPSVCRTNAVVGDASQCDTSKGEQGALRLVKTEKSDMTIVGAFYVAQESGTLPYMLSKLLKDQRIKEETSIAKKKSPTPSPRKPISKDYDL